MHTHAFRAHNTLTWEEKTLDRESQTPSEMKKPKIINFKISLHRFVLWWICDIYWRNEPVSLNYSTWIFNLEFVFENANCDAHSKKKSINNSPVGGHLKNKLISIGDSVVLRSASLCCFWIVQASAKPFRLYHLWVQSLDLALHSDRRSSLSPIGSAVDGWTR